MLNCEDVQERLIAALDEGRVDDGVESHCLGCASCRAVKSQFESLFRNLDELPKPPFMGTDAFVGAVGAGRFEPEPSRESVSAWRAFCDLIARWPAFGVGMAVCLVGIGVLLAPGGSSTLENSQARQSLELLTEEISVLNESLAVLRLQQASASERLRGVGWIEANGQSNDIIIQALAEVLNTDANVNVRLAAIDALSRFTDEGDVRETLVGALETPQSPLVRIALIEALVPLNLPSSREVFQAIVADESYHEAVRERARSALGLSADESTGGQIL